MAVKVDVKENTLITLNEFVSFLETSGTIEKLRNSIYSSEVMSCVATQLRALAANKAHIFSIIIEELEKTDHFQSQNYGQAQGFVLYTNTVVYNPANAVDPTRTSGQRYSLFLQGRT